MNQNYQTQRAWSDTKLEAIKKILSTNAMHFISFEIADEESDTKRSTDMFVRVNGGDIALRVRVTGYRDLTLRTRSQNGGKTEITKIREGFAKWYLYVWFKDYESKEPADYLIVDLDKLRASGLLDNLQSIPNLDGYTAFAPIDIKDLGENGCIVNTTLKKA